MKTIELETKVVHHLKHKAKWLEEKNAARKRAMNERAKHKEQIEKVGAAANKLEGHVMNVQQMENRAMSRLLVHEKGRCKASDEEAKKVQKQLDDASVVMRNLRAKPGGYYVFVGGKRGKSGKQASCCVSF